MDYFQNFPIQSIVLILGMLLIMAFCAFSLYSHNQSLARTQADENLKSSIKTSSLLYIYLVAVLLSILLIVCSFEYFY